MKPLRLIVGVAVAGGMLAVIRTSPASAFLAIVNDPINGIKLLSQLANQASQIRNEVTQITNQGTQIAHEVRNLSKLPSLNLGNITDEVGSVTSVTTQVPGQVQGIAASAKLLQNSLADASRAAKVNDTIGSADGAVQQQQLGNAQLGNIEGYDAAAMIMSDSVNRATAMTALAPAGLVSISVAYVTANEILHRADRQSGPQADSGQRMNSSHSMRNGYEGADGTTAP